VCSGWCSAARCRDDGIAPSIVVVAGLAGVLLATNADDYCSN
jgi:hypothetical protein